MAIPTPLPGHSSFFDGTRYHEVNWGGEFVAYVVEDEDKTEGWVVCDWRTLLPLYYLKADYYQRLQQQWDMAGFDDTSSETLSRDGGYAHWDRNNGQQWVYLYQEDWTPGPPVAGTEGTFSSHFEWSMSGDRRPWFFPQSGEESITSINVADNATGGLSGLFLFLGHDYAHSTTCDDYLGGPNTFTSSDTYTNYRCLTNATPNSVRVNESTTITVKATKGEYPALGSSVISRQMKAVNGGGGGYSDYSAVSTQVPGPLRSAIYNAFEQPYTAEQDLGDEMLDMEEKLQKPGKRFQARGWPFRLDTEKNGEPIQQGVGSVFMLNDVTNTCTAEAGIWQAENVTNAYPTSRPYFAASDAEWDSEQGKYVSTVADQTHSEGNKLMVYTLQLGNSVKSHTAVMVVRAEEGTVENGSVTYNHYIEVMVGKELKRLKSKRQFVFFDSSKKGAGFV